MFVWGAMTTSNVNLRFMIKVIKDATKCDAWADDVTKMLDDAEPEKNSVPEYLWSFFDLTGGFHYIKQNNEIQNIPWIQKQMTEKRFAAIIERMSAFKFNESINVEEGNLFLTENMAFEESEDLKQYYDSYPQPTSWAVLQLFVHRTIRIVGKGDEPDNKYCFWPLSQPWVNHRPIDVSLIGGDQGYINSLSTRTSVEWSTQEGISVPYSVSDETVSAEDKIEMEFMINSGESKSNAEEYVHDKHSNSSAGNLHCVKLSDENLDLCIDLLSVSYHSD
jgi:hypothetical protein